MTDPHPVDEDPEENIGEEVADPWDDPERPDWKTIEEASEGGNASPGPSTP